MLQKFRAIIRELLPRLAPKEADRRYHLRVRRDAGGLSLHPIQSFRVSESQLADLASVNSEK